MCRFYAMRPKDIYELTVEEYAMLWQAITVIEARETLLDFSISDYPQLTKDSRTRLHRDMTDKAAYPKPDLGVVSTEHLAKFLSGLGG